MTRKEESYPCNQWESDLRAAVGTPEGRRVLERIIAYGKLMSPAFVAGSPDATAYNCGRREPVQWLYGEIRKVSPETVKTFDLV